jgi:hypothetical protein
MRGFVPGTSIAIPSAMPPHKNVSNSSRERRQSERAIAYWARKAQEFTSPPTLMRLDPGPPIDHEGWSHRFVIAPDRLTEVSTFLMCGSNVARLLELSDSPLKYAVMFRHMPKRFRELFAQGCARAVTSGSPARMEGTIEREDGRQELYRTVFMPVGTNLVFGAFNSRLRELPSRSYGRFDDRFIREMAAAIDEIRAAGTVSPSAIAAALNDRGIPTIRGRRWTAATLRNLQVRMSK